MRRGHDRPTGREARPDAGTGDPGQAGAHSVGYQEEQQQGYPSETVDYGRGATGQGYPQESAQGGRRGARAYPEAGGGYGPRQAAEPARQAGGAALTILTGLLMAFTGITGIIKGAFFSSVATYPFSYSVRSRGITELIVGAVLLMAGVCLLLGMHWAKHLAMFALVISGIVSFIFIPFYPFWSILLLALSAFALWEVAQSHHRREMRA